MINKDALGHMKDGVIVLNFARDLLVDEEALVDALEAGKVKNMSQTLPHRKLQVSRRDCNSSSRSFYRRI